MAPLRVWLMASTALMMSLPACSSATGSDSATPSSSTRARAAITVLAIGDSDTTGIGDPSGRGWAGRYGDLLHRKLSAAVHVNNRAVEGQTSDELRTAVTGDEALRQALAKADVVLIGLGGADLNAGDEALRAKRCDGRACYTPILRRFGENITAIATEVHRLNHLVLLRAISLPNVTPVPETRFRRSSRLTYPDTRARLNARWSAKRCRGTGDAAQTSFARSTVRRQTKTPIRAA